MSTVIIVGGGFAGTAAARKFAGKNIDVHLFDTKPSFDFLPLLPDVLGQRLSAASVSQDYRAMAARYGFTFHEETIVGIDLQSQNVSTEKEAYAYDYLIVATGAETNFYGNREAAANALPLRSLKHVHSIIETLEKDTVGTVVIVGGGYTGIETATHVRRYARKKGKDLQIIIVERKNTIFPSRGEWIRKYLSTQLATLDIMLETGATLEVEQKRSGTTPVFGRECKVRSTTGETFENCAVIWNAGVAVTTPFDEGTVETDTQGRIYVDRYLRAAERCYVIGDAARVEHHQGPLPMASYFAVQQGRTAASNIIRESGGTSLKAYAPIDYGLVIPLAHGRGCGTLLGVRVKGVIPVLVHHVASFLRTDDRSTRRSIVRDLFGEGIGL
jgi:NADH dehydrogenase